MQARRINVAERARADGELAWQQPVHDERMQLFSVEPRATCALSSRYCGMCTFALVNLHASSRQTETGSQTAVKAAATAAPLRVCLAKELLRGTADAAWWAVRLHNAPNAMRTAARCRARQLGAPRRQPAHMLRAPRSRVQTAALATQCFTSRPPASAATGSRTGVVWAPKGRTGAWRGDWRRWIGSHERHGGEGRPLGCRRGERRAGGPDRKPGGPAPTPASCRIGDRGSHAARRLPATALHPRPSATLHRWPSRGVLLVIGGRHDRIPRRLGRPLHQASPPPPPLTAAAPPCRRRSPRPSPRWSCSSSRRRRRKRRRLQFRQRRSSTSPSCRSAGGGC